MWPFAAGIGINHHFLRFDFAKSIPDRRKGCAWKRFLRWALGLVKTVVLGVRIENGGHRGLCKAAQEGGAALPRMRQKMRLP
jgi:hypothetical protein